MHFIMKIRPLIGIITEILKFIKFFNRRLIEILKLEIAIQLNEKDLNSINKGFSK